ncbi:uncharacterized protein GGS22DRAFT_197208 [Annulohypoxylon maeteangense]|uniref:uncharacterized protein n=1 Tax=Annulohypoxylon maeteangense TaxID=1927788 RepID=UPI0020083802|nr:uncharacterized protein GGS22DRAFT_197208 [Annulohypoxylon maeteangense]KAI0881190.1 hypothetical protein GGS22DRAFT_197208 [Annulohypoxylon maeteangense]
MGSTMLEDRASKLSRLLHSRSTSNMFDIANGSHTIHRSGSPSNSHVSSQRHINTPVSESGRWSIKSLKREWKARTHTRSLSHFPDGRVVDKTIGEYRDPVATLPYQNGRISRLRSRSSSGVLLGGRVAGHQEWPERSSSRKGWGHPLRTSVSSKTLSRIICSEDTTPEMQFPVRKDISRSRSSTRVAAEPTGAYYGYQPTVQVKPPASDSGLDDRNGASPRKVPTQSRPLQRPTLSRGASKNSLTISIENHGQRPEQSNLAYPGTSTSSQQAAERGFLPQQTLAPPKDHLLPDSPGFPKMLAAMTFPSPPTTPRPPSSDRSIGSIIPCQASTADPPTVRPRTSSKRACTSSALPAASLNELLMQDMRPVINPAGLDDASYPAFQSEEWPTARMESTSAPKDRETEDTPLDVDELKYWPSTGTYSTPAGTASDSVTPTTSDNANSLRESLVSEFTTTTNSHRGSPTAVSSKTCTTDGNEVTSYPKGATHRFCHSLPTITPSLAKSCYNQYLGSTDLGLRGYNKNLGAKTMTNMQIASFVDGRKSILERRMARRAKVQAYKRRDLDAAKLALRTAVLGSMGLESNDSPILGWFPDNVAHPRKLSQLEPSHMRTGHIVSIMNGSCDESPLLGEDPTSSKGGQIAPGRWPEALQPTSATSGPSNDWKVSPMMMMEIVPEYASVLRRRQAPDEISLSPIMVVADLESQPGSPVLSVSSVHSLGTTNASSRPALKHRLKIIPQTRPRPVSVMMHRNPTTGDIERTISSTNKANRHSFTSMPSLPPSPSSPTIRRRSHSPGVFSWTQSPIVWDSTIAFEHLVPDTTNQKNGNKDRWCATSMKERLQREKLAREEEISQLVEKTINATKPEEPSGGETEKSQGEHIEQQIEGRIRRLEENGDAWLRVVKGLLENMTKTLHDIKEENNPRGLTMNEFTVNLEMETNQKSVFTPVVSSPILINFNKNYKNKI